MSGALVRSDGAQQTCVYDAGCRLIYLRARYYDPSTGQFISRDPLTALTRAPYSYAADNPLNRVDRTGLDSQATDPHAHDDPQALTVDEQLAQLGAEWSGVGLKDNEVSALWNKKNGQPFDKGACNSAGLKLKQAQKHRGDRPTASDSRMPGQDHAVGIPGPVPGPAPDMQVITDATSGVIILIIVGGIVVLSAPVDAAVLAAG